MNFADEIRQLNNNRPKPEPKLTELETYNIMLECLYRKLKDLIRDNSRHSGELSGTIFCPSDITYSHPFVTLSNIENLETSLYYIHPESDALSEKVCFRDFCKCENHRPFLNWFCTVSLTDAGKKVTNDLTRLFKADGVKVWYSTCITYSCSRTFAGDVQIYTDFGVKTKLKDARSDDFPHVSLILHYEI